MSWHCGDCGSTNLKHTLGNCTGCGKNLDGEQSPASRTEGMFHRACWNARQEQLILASPRRSAVMNEIYVLPDDEDYEDAFDICPESTCPLYGKAVMADHRHLTNRGRTNGLDGT